MESSSELSDDTETVSSNSDIFQSDDSYYDENEEFEPFPITKDEEKEKYIN